MARLRSFLLKATYEWIVNHNLTPYILVDAEYPSVEVPSAYIEEGEIVLNISPLAVKDLKLGLHAVSFEASFSGEGWSIDIPLDAVLGLYAMENSQGLYAHEDDFGMMVYEGEGPEEADPSPEDEADLASSLDRDSKAKNKKSAARANLRVVK